MADQPISLAARRDKKLLDEAKEAHDNGYAFKFQPYRYDDGFGTIDTPEGPAVVVVLDPVALTGIQMSPSTALKFAASLVQAVGNNVLPQDDEGDDGPKAVTR